MIPRDTSVLVVDDFESMRMVTANQLRSLGLERLVLANNGAEALRFLRQQKFDVVLADWNMPVMNGLELLKAVRADARLAGLPFMMITAEAERYRIEEAVAHGVSDLLVKPYTAGRLADRLEKSLSWKPWKPSPAAAAGAAREAVPDTAVPARRELRPTILVVDDTPDNLHLLSSLFKEEFRVRIAHNGEKALSIVTGDDPPDLVLLDVMMPDMDGFQVAKAMRAHPTAENIPVIFVTALIGDDARQQSLELGAVDFVTKPINPPVLKARVKNFMRYVELHKQLQADYDDMLAAAKLRDDVDAITRHDLKGPLAGVIGLVQTLAEDDMLGRKQLECLRLVEETALQALNMVNLSTELYKIETGSFRLDARPVKIGDILRRTVELTRAIFTEKHLTLAVDTDVSVGAEAPQALGDAMLCYSLFQNLVKNACEASPQNGRVTVMLKDENPLRVIIRNHGTVPPAIRERFFEKFVTAGKDGGSGLGTYSARLLAAAQNGRVDMRTSDEEGVTTITVWLPRAG